MFVPMLWRNAADNTLTESLRGMDRFFDEVFAPEGMATDIIEEEQNYRLEAELPGYDKADIHMALKDGNLEISAARNEDRDHCHPEEGRSPRKGDRPHRDPVMRDLYPMLSRNPDLRIPLQG